MLSGHWVLYLLCILIVMGASCRYRITTGELRNLLESNLPKGADKETVIAFLDSKKIEHSGYLAGPEKESDYQENKLDKKKDNIHYYIVSIVRDVKKQMFSLTTHSIQIYFYFDDQGHLVKHSIREVITSM